MNDGKEATGILLVNLGTPDSTEVPDVRRYLEQFLGDPRVLEMPSIARWLLLNAIILPFRPRKAAAAYAKIWTDSGSPLLRASLQLRDSLQAKLGEGYRVELAMRYGNPDIPGTLTRLIEAPVARVMVVPLFPQYANATTGSALAAIFSSLAAIPNPPPVRSLPAFHEDRAFIDTQARLARECSERIAAEHVVMSFHGLPVSQIRSADPTGRHCLESPDCCAVIDRRNRSCYRAHCFATARAIAAALSLETDTWSIAFQSRVGPTAWIGPNLTDHLSTLAARGIRRLAIVCPSFVSDCLETLEEIGIRARDTWLELGGEALIGVPCVNAEPDWVDGFGQSIEAAATEWMGEFDGGV